MLINRRMATLAVMVMVFGLATPVFAQQRTHTVQRGENLTGIAARYGVTVQSLVTTNNLLNPNRILPGQILVIPAAGGPAAQPALIHVVQPGEQLRFIAARYGTTWQTLAAVNNLSNANLIFVGQRLLIPAVGGPLVVQPPLVVGGRYTVRPGDTLFGIARLFGVNAWDIARANGILNLNRIFTGQPLVIPGR